MSAGGFYGGVSLSDRGTESIGLQSTGAPATWARFTTPPADDAASRALVYGGYRWRNDVAVEATFASTDKYALRPADTAPARRGVGLGLGTGASGTPEIAARAWNLDVYGSWAFYKSFALYGRLGYVQAETLGQPPGANLVTVPDTKRLRDGVNYGLGVRYDIGSNLGLRLEYGRAARFGIDSTSALPEADQVSLGVQFRF